MNLDVITSIRKRARPGEVYERIISEFYTRVLTASSVAVDGGANFGLHTFPMARITSSGHIYAIEALPKIFSVLEERARRFPNIEPLCCALSDHIGEADFVHYNSENPDHPDRPMWNAGESGLRQSSEKLKRPHEIISVKTRTLDDILKDEAKLNFIKLDIEGAEYHALKGGEKSLARLRPFIAFEDGGPEVGKIYGYDPSNLTKLFKLLSYRLLDILGREYTQDSWLERREWRPHYTLAIPVESSLDSQVHDSINAALLGFGYVRLY